MVGRRLVRTVGAIGVVVLVVVSVLSAQAQQTAAPVGMAELLTEVRALRADVNQAAGASMRMQLLVARVSLQEQRVNTVGHQLTDVTAQLDAAIRNQAAEVTNLLTAEQNRWSDFNGRLDDLERSLPTATGR